MYRFYVICNCEFTFGITGVNRAKRLLEDSTCASEYEDAALVNELLSLKNVTRPAPPEPSVCVIPMYNFYKLDPA